MICSANTAQASRAIFTGTAQTIERGRAIEKLAEQLDIPGMQFVKSSGVGGRAGLAVCPGFVFVVLGVVT